MPTHKEQWDDKGRARRYAKQTGLAARFIYMPFARQALACLDPAAACPRVVDLGAGPGFLAVALGRLRPQASIVGLDPSAEMLQVAGENAARAGLSSYEAMEGTAEENPLDPGSVDLAVSQSSFHEWHDPQQGLAEVYRILKPGGSLILRDYNLTWLTPWKRRLLGLLHPLHMFKFGFDDVASMAAETGFAQIQGEGKGIQYLLRATKEKE